MSLADIHGITSEFASDPAPFRWIPGQISSLLFAYFAETVVSRFFYPFLPQVIGYYYHFYPLIELDPSW